jgi:hypothetical protein
MQRRVLVVWFKNDHINTAVLEKIPICGRHIQMLEFDNVCIYPLGQFNWLISS